MFERVSKWSDSNLQVQRYKELLTVSIENQILENLMCKDSSH